MKFNLKFVYIVDYSGTIRTKTKVAKVPNLKFNWNVVLCRR